MVRSCRGPPLDDVGACLVGRHFFHHCVRIAVARQPLLRVGHIRGEIDEFGVITGAVEHADRADGWTFDDGEVELRFERKGPVDADGDDAAGAIVDLVQGETGLQRHIAGALTTALPADQAAPAVAGLPGSEFLPESRRRLRRSVRPGDNRADGCVVEDRVRGHRVLHSCVCVETKPPPAWPAAVDRSEEKARSTIPPPP